jgi:hypothetical protein
VGFPLTALAGVAGVNAFDDGAPGHGGPPEAVEWSVATEQPDATEPLSAMASPDVTEPFVALPLPEHTDVASAWQLPDSLGFCAATGAGAGVAAATTACVWVFVFAASAGAVSTMLAAVTRPVIAARQPIPATRILLIFMNLPFAPAC